MSYVMSFAGSGIPASQARAIDLIAVYHGISVQVLGCALDVVMGSFRLLLLEIFKRSSDGQLFVPE